MKRKVRRIATGSVLVAALAVAGATYLVRQAQGANAQTGRRGANGGQSAPSGVASTASSKGPSGSFVGPTVNAYYGYVKVKAIVQNGRVQKVVVLKHPNDNGTSRYINRVAMPYLVQEAVQNQGANIRLISGATLSSEAFVKSLSSALTKAGV